MSRTQALLVREGQNGVSQHNTRCLGTSCGGINPYTLMARLGPAQIRASGPPKDDVRPGQPVRSPAQGVKTDLAIKQDPGRLE